jgi:hypothetical protein
MKKMFIAAVVGLSVVGFNAAAHGPAKAQHGGIVQTANDLSFELVKQANGASIYVVDHDDPADVSKMTGKLTVLTGTEKSEAELKPAGADRLEATGIKLEQGSKVVATLSSPGSKTMTVRFTVR